MGSAWDGPASLGQACITCLRSVNGRTGPRRRRCCGAGPICLVTWSVAPTTRSARARCILARRSTASTAHEPWTIGTQVSSGCIRMRNEDVIDLYTRVKIGTKVVVM